MSNTKKFYIYKWKKLIQTGGISIKRINIMVSDEAKVILLKYKEQNNISTLDEALDRFLLDNEGMLKVK